MLSLTGILAGTAALYTLAAVSHLAFMFRREFDFLARWSTRAAWVIHSVGLAVLVYQTGRAPVHTVFEFTFFFTWILMSNHALMEIIRNEQSAGAFLLPVISIAQVATVAMPKPSPERIIEQEFPASLVGWHIGVSMLGYAFFVASFVAGALYLIQERNLRAKRWGPVYYRLPSLETLDIWGGRFVAVGFPLLTIGVGAGLVFAHVTWARLWQADPKVIFTLLVWMVYGGYLLMRQFRGWGGRRAAWWTVAGVTGLFFNYFVVNWLSHLHNFGVGTR